MISYPKFGSYTPMFRIPDMIDEFRVICFIFKDGVEFSWWFFRCFVRLFSALNRKVEGFLKLTDCLLILSCVLKRFIYFNIRPDLFSSAILYDMFKQSLAMLSGG